MSIDVVTQEPGRTAPWYERHLLLLFAVIAVAVIFAGFYFFTRTPEPSVTFTDPSQPVQVNVGDIFAVTVDATADDAQGWANIPIGMDDPYLTPISTGCDMSKGQCRFVFKAQAAGQKNLTLTWGNTATGLRGTPPAKTTYQYQINIAP